MKLSLVESETIAAISTPPGAGGIGVIRMSGGRSLPILKDIFTPENSDCSYSSHRLYYGRITHPESHKILDEVLVVYMRSPRTYTREDVVEIQCHGSFLVLNNILELLLSRGVRLAAPGEFTKRAFLNGRIDLTKAEAVIDILAARTKKGVDLAMDQLSGSLFRQIEQVRKSVTHLRAIIEVAIDFPDEDVEILEHSHLLDQLVDEVQHPLERLLKNAESGKIFREGISVVIIGAPNVGKSSLLNTLLQEERALVTAIPGTTRDTIEEYIDIKGMPVRIVDTAGIRDHFEEVEGLGIERAKEQMQKADVVLFMVDGSAPISEADKKLYEAVAHKDLILVKNKSDLVEGATVTDTPFAPGKTTVTISAKQQQGIDDLKEALFASVVGGSENWQEAGCAPNVRHKDALQRAHSACLRVKEGIELGLTSDLIAVDLQDVLDELGEIVGLTTTEDILDVIFEQFCLGK